MKVILSGGGTGGHIYPALTIADQIKAIRPDVEITFVGTRQGLEKDIIPRYGYNLEFIDVAGFKRSLSLDTLRSGIKLLHGLKDAYSLLDKLKPDFSYWYWRLCLWSNRVFSFFKRYSHMYSGTERNAWCN